MTSAAVVLKRGQKRSDISCSGREKEGEEQEQPTCYHTVFNNSVAATRGLHVHATAVQCLLGVCATHKRDSVQKSSHAALSVSCREAEAASYLRFAANLNSNRNQDVHLCVKCFLNVKKKLRFQTKSRQLLFFSQ